MAKCSLNGRVTSKILVSCHFFIDRVTYKGIHASRTLQWMTIAFYRNQVACAVWQSHKWLHWLQKSYYFIVLCQTVTYFALKGDDVDDSWELAKRTEKFPRHHLLVTLVNIAHDKSDTLFKLVENHTSRKRVYTWLKVRNLSHDFSWKWKFMSWRVSKSHVLPVIWVIHLLILLQMSIAQLLMIVQYQNLRAVAFSPVIFSYKDGFNSWRASTKW